MGAGDDSVNPGSRGGGDRVAAHTVRQRYGELFGEQPRSKHKDSLVRRIAWRLQANAEGDLSGRARRRALDIAADADLRVLPPRAMTDAQLGSRPALGDRRIPRPGAVLTRQFRGQNITVTVLPEGFDYQGRQYRSFSALASEVTGTRWNGLAFFGLTREQRAACPSNGFRSRRSMTWRSIRKRTDSPRELSGSTTTMNYRLSCRPFAAWER